MFIDRSHRRTTTTRRARQADDVVSHPDPARRSSSSRATVIARRRRRRVDARRRAMMTVLRSCVRVASRARAGETMMMMIQGSLVIIGDSRATVDARMRCERGLDDLTVYLARERARAWTRRDATPRHSPRGDDAALRDARRATDRALGARASDFRMSEMNRWW